MAYSDLKKLKKEEIKDITKVEVDNLIVGGDLFSLATFEFLKSKFPNDNTKILTKEIFDKEDVNFIGPKILRGTENIEYVKSTFDFLDVKESTEVPKFYKDMKFKPFGGRSKSEKLMWGEEFYTTPAADIELSKLFSFLGNEDFYSMIKENQIELLYSKIFKEDEKWIVECTNGTQLICKKLYWTESPWKFYEDFNGKGKLSNEFIEFVESTKTPCALHVKLELDKHLTDQEETLLIPLSYTHEWGHFICEFSKKDTQEDKQVGEFLTFVDVNDTNEEDISKKIRLLKRNLEKIYPKFKEVKTREFIVLTENTHSLNFDDSFALEKESFLEGAFFVSSSAPFYYNEVESGSDADSSRGLSHIARGLKVMAQLKNLLA